MVELIRSPESMKTVHEELAREISDNLIKISNLPQLPYLQACHKENLRLHLTTLKHGYDILVECL